MKVMQMLWKTLLDAFNSHPSIERIRRIVKTNENFSFQTVPEDLVRKIVLKLDGSKATPVGDIPANTLKSTVDIHLPFITKTINFSFENGCFPDELKLAEVSPIFKKKEWWEVELPGAIEKNSKNFFIVKTPPNS